MTRWLLAGCLTLLGTTTALAQQRLWEVYHDAGGSAHRRGYDADAEKLWKTALEAAAKDGPKVHYQVATLENLVGMYLEQDRLADAEALLKKIIEVSEATLGKDASAVAGYYAKLGEFYQTQFANRDADAEPNLRHALDILAKEQSLASVYGPGVGLFQCQLFQNKLTEAEATLKWCLATVDKNPGPLQASARAACLHGMAMIHYKRKQDAEAEADYQRALEGLEKTRGPEDPAMLWSLYHAGNYYHALLGRSDQVPEFYYARALAIAKKSGQATSGQTSQVLLALGQIYHARKLDDQARPCFEEALKAADNLPDDASPGDKVGVAVLRLQVARFYIDQGKLADAEAMGKKSLTQVDEVKGAPKKELGRCYRGLTDCAIAQNKLAEADSYAHKALEADQKWLGPAHGYQALDMCRLARVARLRNQDAEAERLCQQALPIAQREIGITRPEVREVVDEYEALLRKTNRAAEAQQLETRAVGEFKLPPPAGAAAPAIAQPGHP
jgi:hypothetical protein